MPNPKRCYLCQERGSRPMGKPEYVLELDPFGDEPHETYNGICADCLDDMVTDAQDAGRGWFFAGFVP